jgi:hypothetical protein
MSFGCGHEIVAMDEMGSGNYFCELCGEPMIVKVKEEE